MARKNVDETEVVDEFSGDNSKPVDRDEFDPDTDGDTEPGEYGTTGIDDDELRALGFDDSGDEEVWRTMNPPSGDWIKSAEWKFRKYHITTDVQDGDSVPGAGRLVYVFYGPLDAREYQGHTFTPTARVEMSRDKRPHREKPGEWDLKTKMFIAAKNLFLSKKGRKPQNQGQIIDMICLDEFAVNMSKGDNGLFCMGIKEKSERAFRRAGNRE